MTRHNTYPDFEVSTFPEVGSLPFNIVEIRNDAELDESLLIQGADPSTLASENVRGATHNMLARTQEAGKKLFLAEVNGASWAVVAGSEQDVSLTEETVENIANLQAHIKPDSLSGECIGVHEYASSLGISNGNLGRKYKSTGHVGSIYPDPGIHEIGYNDVVSAGKTVYFDLTSKVYSFADKEADEAVLEGLIIVEDIGHSEAVSNIYQSDWRREPFEPDQSKLDYILQSGSDRFLTDK
jgi:hypothetical protein